MNVRAFTGIALGAAISMASACASTGVRPQPFPTPPERPESPPPEHPLATPGASLGDGFTIASAALRLQGLPYRVGGSDPHGFDCSGFVQYVFSLYGVALPRIVRDQYHAGRKVSLDDVVPGDLVFFNTRRFAYSHVGIYLGDNRFIHAPSQGGDAEIATFSAAYWQKRFNGARRLAGSMPSLAPSIISSATAAPLAMQLTPEVGVLSEGLSSLGSSPVGLSSIGLSAADITP